MKDYTLSRIYWGCFPILDFVHGQQADLKEKKAQGAKKKKEAEAANKFVLRIVYCVYRVGWGSLGDTLRHCPTFKNITGFDRWAKAHPTLLKNPPFLCVLCALCGANNPC